MNATSPLHPSAAGSALHQPTPGGRRRLGLRLASAAALAAVAGSTLLLVGGSPSSAAGFAVTTTADGGTGSLRAAIDAANANPGPDLITVPAGAYTLSIDGRGEDANQTGDLDILGDVLIVGSAGAGTTTIDGAGLDRVFDVVGGSLSIQGLTVTGGDPGVELLQEGGAIRALGHPITVLDSVLASNTAHNGGAVFATSTTASFQRSWIDSNTAVSLPGNGSDAGGLDLHATLTTISDTTISNNESILGNAGGISLLASPATITNSTISGNKAGNNGGGIDVGGAGTIQIRHTTFAENDAAGTNGAGGAVHMRGGEVALQNTLFWQNTTKKDGGESCGRDTIFPGTVTTAGGNLSDDGSCTTLTDPTDHLSDGGTTLGALASNGGPTPTRALIAGSSAIDSAPCTGAVTADQRSFSRPAGAACDTGAYEAAGVAGSTTTSTTQAPPTTPTTASVDEPTTTSTTVPDDVTPTSEAPTDTEGEPTTTVGSDTDQTDGEPTTTIGSDAKEQVAVETSPRFTG